MEGDGWVSAQCLMLVQATYCPTIPLPTTTSIIVELPILKPPNISANQFPLNFSALQCFIVTILKLSVCD